jgi:putative peptide zinc metalloprotease protein
VSERRFGVRGGKFPERYRVSAATTAGRYIVEDPERGTRWALGLRELTACRAFDGVRDYEQIAEVLRERGGAPPSRPALQALEDRLLTLGLLEPDAPRPRTGVVRVHHMLHGLWRLELVTLRPGRRTDAVLRRLAALSSAGAVAALSVSALAVLAGLAPHLGRLVAETPRALGGPGLFACYVVAWLSAVFHEGAHMLSCRRYGVGVKRVGIGLLGLLPFASTEPHQDDWDRLPARKRIVTVVVGPLGSLLFAELSAWVWLLGHDVKALRLLGIYGALSGTLLMVPTLVPIFPGDAYLLLTQWLGRPNLRWRSFDHLLFVVARRRTSATRGEATLYVGFAAATIVGWLAGLAVIGWALWRVLGSPGIGW